MPKPFTVSVAVEVTVTGDSLDEVRGRAFRRLLACAKRMTKDYSVNVESVEYQNDSGETVTEDYR